MKLRIFRLFFLLLVAGTLMAVFAAAQNSAPSAGAQSTSPTPDNPPAKAVDQPSTKNSDTPAAGQPGQAQNGGEQVDPLKRPVSETKKKANSKAMKQELSST